MFVSVPGSRRAVASLVSSFAAILATFLLGLLPVSGVAQTATSDATTPVHQTLAPESDLIHLPTATDVTANVTVDAALLPYSVSRRIFGTEVAKHYAVVQLVLSNHNAASAMIVQSVLLDYSHWLFSGTFSAFSHSPDGPLNHFQTANQASQVASAEARLVRSQLQDAQQWTARNWTVRSAVLLGATAAGFQFLFGTDYAKGSNAFNGNLIPGLQQLWPDATQAQINRISDFGFGTNHVIPTNASDVIVGFFPLDRFLTPDLQDIFRKAPSAFFNPSEMLVDCTYGPKLLNLLRRAGALNSEVQPELRQHAWSKPCAYRNDPGKEENASAAKLVGSAILHYEQFLLQQGAMAAADPVQAAKKQAEALASVCQLPSDARQTTDPVTHKTTTTPATTFNRNDCLLLTLLDKVSLNNIRVVASGIMTVDTNRVPAILNGITFDSDSAQAAFWKGPAKDGDDPPQHKAILLGAFVAGGQVTYTATYTATGKTLTKLPLTSVTLDPTASDETHLAFTYTVPADVPSNITLTFTVTKSARDNTRVTSAPLLYPVKY